MAVGKQSITIDSDELAKGLTTSSNLTDGGFSPESDAVNLVSNPGVLYPPNGATTIGTLDGNVTAISYDTQSINSGIYKVDKYLMTDNGSIYTLINGSLAKVSGSLNLGGTTQNVQGANALQIFGVDGSNNPVLWLTNLQGAFGYSYTYSTNSLSSDASPGFSGWTSNPHPMVVFNKLLFFADGNRLHTWDGASAVTGVLTLQSDQIITALSIDPNSGRMLVGVSSSGSLTVANGDKSTLFYSPAFIGLYDGTNPTQFIRKIGVDGTVTSFLNCGGVTYVTYGNNFGIFNGSGIQFLRKLFRTGINLLNYINVYQHKICNLDDTVFFVDNSLAPNKWLTSGFMFQVMAYGNVAPGDKSFFPIVSLPSNSAFYIDFVANLQNQSIIYSQNKILYSMPIYQHASVLNTGDTSPIWVSKRIAFSRPSTINQITVFYEDSIAAGTNSPIGNITTIDDSLLAVYTEGVTNTSALATTMYNIYPDIQPTTQLQIKYQWLETNTSHGIQKIIVYFTPYE